MTVNRKPLKPVPAAVSAWAKKQKKNPVIAIADLLDRDLDWHELSEIYSNLGQPGIHPRVLVIVTLLQHANGLSDRQAVECLETRLDWKYAARMDLDESAFDHTVLSEFRGRLIESNLADLLLNNVLRVADESGFLKPGKQRTDSTHVLANVRELGRIERVHEAFRVALDLSACNYPDEFLQFGQKRWLIDYDKRPYNFKAPKQGKQRDALVQKLGCDVAAFLEGAAGFAEYGSSDEVQVLKRIFEQQMILTDTGWRLRNDDESLQNSDRIASPHDTDARFGRKGDLGWLGYKVHYTETCSPGGPRLITNALTVPATTDDSAVLLDIHSSLKQRGLAPQDHLVDTGYTDIRAMHTSEKFFGIRVVGPVKPDPSWQARAKNGFEVERFTIDFQNKFAVCPAGKTSSVWSIESKRNRIKIGFQKSDCSKCPFREACTKSEAGRRLVVPQPELYAMMRSRRTEQQTDDFKREYKLRSGVEGTHSQAVRKAKYRRSRFSDLAKTSAQSLFVAAGLNLYRLAEWLFTGRVAQTRRPLTDKLAVA